MKIGLRLPQTDEYRATKPNIIRLAIEAENADYSDSARTEEIINTIRKCPSGALSYSIDGIEYRDQNERQPMVTVSKDGPYLITGGIDLIGDNIQWAEGASKEHYTLCRCGASNNKPFCDGMHRTVNFRDDKN